MARPTHPTELTPPPTSPPLMKRNRAPLVAAVALGVGVASLPACGGSEESGDVNQGTGGTQAPMIAPMPDPGTGGVLLAPMVPPPMVAPMPDPGTGGSMTMPPMIAPMPDPGTGGMPAAGGAAGQGGTAGSAGQAAGAGQGGTGGAQNGDGSGGLTPPMIPPMPAPSSS